MIITTTIVVLQVMTSSSYLLVRLHDRNFKSEIAESLTNRKFNDAIRLVFIVTITEKTFSWH